MTIDKVNKDDGMEEYSRFEDKLRKVSEEDN